MAKDFVRHLEFYGFPDQNTFTSEGNVDLSDIRNKNDEQDEAIECISRREHASMRALHAVDMKHTRWNNGQDIGIGKLFKGLSAVKDFANDMSDTVSAMSNDIEVIGGNINTINDEIEDIFEIIGGDTGSTSIKEQVEKLSGDVEDLSDKVDEISANTYTKEEVDALISGSSEGIATEEWVKEQGYFTQASGDSRYYTKDESDAMKLNLENQINTVDGKITQVKSDLIELSGTTNAKFNVIDRGLSALTNQFDDFRVRIDGRIDDIEHEITSGITPSINNLKARVDAVEQTLPNKADKSDITALNTEIDRLDGRIDNLSASTNGKLDGKVDKTEFNTYTGTIESALNTIEDDIDALSRDKADKVYIDTTVKGWVNAEKARAEAAESDLGARIDADGTRMTNIESVNTRQDNDLDTLTHRIADEETNRATEDAKLLGKNTDTHDANTIWGAKKYAEEMKADAISTARTYTDSQITIIRNNDLAAERAYVDSSLSTKADKTYVNAQDTQLDNKIDKNYNLLHQYTDTAVGDEKTERQAADTAMDADIRALNTQVGDLNTKVNEISNVGLTGELNIIHQALHDLIAWMKDNVGLPVDFHPEI